MHVRVLSYDGDDLIFSTHAEDGGAGQPLAFKLCKGRRGPRAWELALLGAHPGWPAPPPPTGRLRAHSPTRPPTYPLAPPRPPRRPVLLAEMTKGQRRVLKTQASYAYGHADCKTAPPKGATRKDALTFDLLLLTWLPGDGVRAYGVDEDVFKHPLNDGGSWETARAPNEVRATASGWLAAWALASWERWHHRWRLGPVDTSCHRTRACSCRAWQRAACAAAPSVTALLPARLHRTRRGGATAPGEAASTLARALAGYVQVSFTCTLRTLAYDGAPRTGFAYYSSAQPLQLQLGQGQLPPGVEEALSHMSKGEHALFILPAGAC